MKHLQPLNQTQKTPKHRPLMDYQNRIGSKKGSGGVASQSLQNVQTAKRVNQLFDISSDPYVFKNHLGQLECRLCFTQHNNNESYLNHVSGRKHQTNLLRRSDKRETVVVKNEVEKRKFDKIGRPGYSITKIRGETYGVLVKVSLDQCKEEPEIRLMSVFENEQDTTKDENWCYLVIYAEPYETIAVKIPNKVKDQLKYWDTDVKEFYVQIMFNDDI